MTAIVASRQNFHHPDNTSDSNTENNTMHSTREPAKNVFVYLNGNRYYPGRKFVVNRRYLHDFNGFLTEVTRGIKPSFGAIRNIYTPNQGHRVDDLKQLENNMELVAGGKEKFYQMGYRDIIARPRMMHNPKKVSLNKAPPKSRLQVPGRWRAYVKEPCQIYVYGNGDIIAPATKLLLTPRQMKSWDLVLQHITEKIGNRTGQAARKLYDLNYRLLHDPSELEGGQHYIAVGSEKLKRCPYGQIAALRGHNQISPRKANQPLPPIKRTQKQKKEDGDGQSFAKTQNKRKPKEEVVTSENVVTGLQPLKIKRQPQPPTTERPTNEKESVFHAKPVKVKRSPPVLTQTDEGGIFSANNKPEHADEVKEDENTKIDLPVDQIPAEIVNDEEINSISPREVSDLIVNNKDENSNDVANPQDLSNMDVSTPNFSEQTWSISEGQTAIADNNREQSLQNLHQNSQDNRDLNGNINNDAVSKPIQDNLEVLQKESDSVEVGEKMFRKSSESEDLFLTSTNETFEQSIESSPYNTENISEQITSERDNLLGDKEEDKEILSKVEITSQDLQQEKSLTLVLDEQSSIDFQNSKITDVATNEPSSPEMTSEQPAKSPVATKEPSLSDLTTEQPAKSPVATKEPSLSDLTPEQPAKSPVATKESSLSDLAPEQPAKSPVATKDPSLSDLTSEEPAKSPVATKEPSSLDLTPEQPAKSPVATKEPSLLDLAPEQPAKSPVATKKPSLLDLAPEQPLKSPVATKELSLSDLASEQPLKSPVTTKEPSLSSLTSEEPLKSPVATKEPSSPDLIPEQPAKSPVATKEPSSLELTPEEPTKSPVVTKEPSLSSLVPEQPANKFEATFSELNQDFLGYKSEQASLDTGNN